MAMLDVGCSDGSRTPLCPCHSFRISPQSPGLYVSQEVRVDLCPMLNRVRGRMESVIPRLNLNGAPTDLAFEIEFESSRSDPLVREQKEAMILKGDASDLYQEELASDLHGQVLVQPLPRHLFCHVCRESFPDYLQHINRSCHKSNLRSKKVSKYIDQLVGVYQTHSVSKLTLRKSASAQAEFTGQRVREQEVRGGAHKKRKIEQCSILQKHTLSNTNDTINIVSTLRVEEGA